MNTISSPSDLEAVKARIKAVWTAGDFGKIAELYADEAANFVARLELVPGAKVLDACCGSGNLAIPAARGGAAVTGMDIAPNLLQAARARAAAEQLDIRFEEGDVEALPYPDHAFDVVMSMFGVIFAPRPELAAAELLRVSRPGGTIALANWKPSSFVAEMLRATARYLPPQPGVPSPLSWGEEGHVFNLLRAGVGYFKFTTRLVRFCFAEPPEQAVAFWVSHYGPAQKAFQALAAMPDRQSALLNDYLRLWKHYNVADGKGTEIESEYLELIATRRTD